MTLSHCSYCNPDTAGNHQIGCPHRADYWAPPIVSDDSPTLRLTTTVGTKLVGVPFCPDLLRIEDIGEADNFRGRVVRAFFRLIVWWKP